MSEMTKLVKKRLEPCVWSIISPVTLLLALSPVLLESLTLDPWSFKIRHRWKGEWTSVSMIPVLMLIIRWQQRYDQPITKFQTFLKNSFECNLSMRTNGGLDTSTKENSPDQGVGASYGFSHHFSRFTVMTSGKNILCVGNNGEVLSM